MNHSKTPGSARPTSASTPASPAKPANTPGASAVPKPPQPTARPATAAQHGGKPDATRGKVVHDERGTAVWDWLKQTGRNAIESTTRLLRKLEAPELQVEQPHEEELRIAPDSGVDAGGGYDPYNQPTKSRRTPGK